MLKHYPTLLLLLLLIGFSTTKRLSYTKTVQKPFSESLFGLEFFKESALESWDMLYSTCGVHGFEELYKKLDSASLDRIIKICERYRSNILRCLLNLETNDKISLLRKIATENCQQLQEDTTISDYKKYYHLYCIDFAEKELAILNQLVIAQQ